MLWIKQTVLNLNSARALRDMVSLCGFGWPSTQRDPSTVAFQILGLEMCSITNACPLVSVVITPMIWDLIHSAHCFLTV